MKTIQIYWEKADRGSISIALILLVIMLHAMGCAKPTAGLTADELTTDLTAAQRLPDWAPKDADPQVRYYFLPEINVYYDAYAGQYVYLDQGVWLAAPALPSAYVEFDLFSAHIVYLEVGITRPWVNNHFYVRTYPVTYFYGHPGLHRGYGWRCYNENRRHFCAGPVHPSHYKHGFRPGGVKEGWHKPGPGKHPMASGHKPNGSYKVNSGKGGPAAFGNKRQPAKGGNSGAWKGRGDQGGKPNGMRTSENPGGWKGSPAKGGGGWNTPGKPGGKAPMSGSGPKQGGGKGGMGKH